MVQKIGIALCGAGLLAAAFAQSPKIEYKPLQFGGFSEFGMLQSGQYGANTPFHDEWLDHFGAYITQTVVSDDNLAFDIGLGGVFEYQKREVIGAQWGGTQYKNFFSGPSVADLRYGSAARDGQGWGLTFGMFPYKYNPDASNLGEYLFRSGTYPGYITSGGLWTVNSTVANLQALKINYGKGGFNADLFLITETSMPALYDISAAAVVGYKSESGLFDVGAGLDFKHMIPIKPSRTSPHVLENAYFQKNGSYHPGTTQAYVEEENFWKRRATEDPANAATYLANAANDSTMIVQDSAWLANPADSGVNLKYYTQQGLIAMVRASVDLKKLFESDLFGPNDMRLYTEAAIIGVQNYPLYYDKIMQRIPIMAGFNVPTFKLLDLLSVQAEYYGSRYLNSYENLVGFNAGTPAFPGGNDAERSKLAYDDITKHDNISWSVLAKKVFGGGAFIAGQVARDHLRTVSIVSWTALEPTEVLGRSGDWYWMLQFGYGI